MMLHKKIVLIISIFISFFSTGLLAKQDSGLIMMNRMIQSFSELSYDGVFVSSHGTEMNSMQIRHSVIDDVEHESIVDLDGTKIEMIRIGDNVVCVYPNMSFSNSRGPITGPFKKLKELSGERVNLGYRFVISDGGVIAGRKAEKLELQPKDSYRFTHYFWLDAETGFLLRHDTINVKGKVLSKVQFTSLNTSPNLQKSDFVPHMSGYTEHVERIDPKVVDSVWSFEWLPQGFEPVWEGAREMEQNTVMMLLSDGITSISVFVEPSKGNKELSITQMGSTIAGEQTRTVNGNSYLVTAVGEVPSNTIRKLLTMIMPIQQ